MTITPPVKNPAAVALGRLGGRAGGVTSAAKAAACRRNGLLGGRPPKTPPVQTLCVKLHGGHASKSGRVFSA